jgi:hypothetical protein
MWRSVHFIKQQVGFFMLYQAMAGERGAADYRLDKLAIWLGALGPLALWHADPLAAMKWFGADEEVALRIPTWLANEVVCLMGVVHTTWIARQVWLYRSGRPASIPKMVWVVASWASWWMGFRVAANFIVATAFISLFHGIPYTALVW